MTTASYLTVLTGAPSRSTTRTWEKWLTRVARLFVEEEKDKRVEEKSNSRRGKGY